MRYHECPFCGDEIDAADYEYFWPHHGGQSITRCVGCQRSFEVHADASFDDGAWRDCSTITPLKELPR
jgi:C4-type Zn-finger protein